MSVGGMLGRGAGVLFGLATRKWRTNRGVMSDWRKRTRAFLKPVLLTLRVLFLEATGLIFLCLSLTVFVALWREYHKYLSHESSLERVVLAGVVSLMFLYFGLTSFWRAWRKRSRSQA